jgi:hypothetical protein
LEHGYPSAYKSNKELTETVTDWIGGTGAFRNQFDVKAEEEYKLEKDLEETSKKPAFKVRSDMVNDWTGQKYVEEYNKRDKTLIQLEGKPDKKKKWISIEEEKEIKDKESAETKEHLLKSAEKNLPPCPKCAAKKFKEEEKPELPIIKSKKSPPLWATNPTAD